MLGRLTKINIPFNDMTAPLLRNIYDVLLQQKLPLNVIQLLSSYPSINWGVLQKLRLTNATLNRIIDQFLRQHTGLCLLAVCHDQLKTHEDWVAVTHVLNAARVDMEALRDNIPLDQILVPHLDSLIRQCEEDLCQRMQEANPDIFDSRWWAESNETQITTLPIDAASINEKDTLFAIQSIRFLQKQLTELTEKKEREVLKIRGILDETASKVISTIAIQKKIKEDRLAHRQALFIFNHLMPKLIGILKNIKLSLLEVGLFKKSSTITALKQYFHMLNHASIDKNQKPLLILMLLTDKTLSQILESRMKEVCEPTDNIENIIGVLKKYKKRNYCAEDANSIATLFTLCLNNTLNLEVLTNELIPFIHTEEANVMVKSDKHDGFCKITVMGANEVGRTSFISTVFLDEAREPVKSYRIIPDTTFKIAYAQFASKTIKFEIWDASPERLHKKWMDHELIDERLKYAHLGIVCYDVSSEASFRDVERYVKLMRQSVLTDKDKPILLIGCKSELIREREVTPEQGEALAKKLGLAAFHECSANHLYNVKEVLTSVVRQFYKSIANPRYQRSLTNHEETASPSPLKEPK